MADKHNLANLFNGNASAQHNPSQPAGSSVSDKINSVFNHQQEGEDIVVLGYPTKTVDIDGVEVTFTDTDYDGIPDTASFMIGGEQQIFVLPNFVYSMENIGAISAEELVAEIGPGYPQFEEFFSIWVYGEPLAGDIDDPFDMPYIEDYTGDDFADDMM